MVETPTGVRFFLEAKSFEKETVLHKIKARVFSLGHMSLQKRANRLVKDAAKLLPRALEKRRPSRRGFADLGDERVNVSTFQVGVEQPAREVAAVADRRTKRDVDVEARIRDSGLGIRQFPALPPDHFRSVFPLSCARI